MIAVVWKRDEMKLGAANIVDFNYLGVGEGENDVRSVRRARGRFARRWR